MSLLADQSRSHSRVADQARPREALLLIMITMANDRIGYIIKDAGHEPPTFEASGTPLKLDAEKSIVHTLMDMMSTY